MNLRLGDRIGLPMRKTKFALITTALVLTICLATQVAQVSAAAAYQDEFTATTLQSFWTFNNPLGTGAYSLTAHSGYLRITAPVGVALAPSSNENAPRMLQSVTGDFVASTYVTGSFSEDGDRAGLLLWKDASNFIRLEKWSLTKAQVYAVIGGSGTSTQISGLTSSTNLYLKLEKIGTTVNAYYSTNGATWTLIKATTFSSSDPLQVGLFSLNVGTVSHNADFDYFRVTPYSTLTVLPEYPIGIFGASAAIVGAWVFFKVKGVPKFLAIS
jgi:regulation of enolase protein 1 (concanavalin A-like superfamily)